MTWQRTNPGGSLAAPDTVELMACNYPSGVVGMFICSVSESVRKSSFSFDKRIDFEDIRCTCVGISFFCVCLCPCVTPFVHVFVRSS